MGNIRIIFSPKGTVTEDEIYGGWGLIEYDHERKKVMRTRCFPSNIVTSDSRLKYFTADRNQENKVLVSHIAALNAAKHHQVETLSRLQSVCTALEDTLNEVRDMYQFYPNNFRKTYEQYMHAELAELEDLKEFLRSSVQCSKKR
jgi:hypothetical protein